MLVVVSGPTGRFAEYIQGHRFKKRIEHEEFRRLVEFGLPR